MARTRQKAKQRKAKRLEQERKAQGTTGQKPPSNPAEQAAVDQATAYEVGDALEEAGGKPAVAARRIQEEQSDEAVKPVRDSPAKTATKAPAKAPERQKAPARERRAERRDGRRKTRPERKREVRPRGRVFNFFVQVWAELQRVQWPNRSAVSQATAVVIVFVVITGSYLAIWDYVFDKLIRAII